MRLRCIAGYSSVRTTTAVDVEGVACASTIGGSDAAPLGAGAAASAVVAPSARTAPATMPISFCCGFAVIESLLCEAGTGDASRGFSACCGRRVLKIQPTPFVRAHQLDETNGQK